MLQPTSSAVKCLTKITKSFELTQIVNEPTRIARTSATLLDLILVSCKDNIIKYEVLDTDVFTDHNLVFLNLRCELQQKQQSYIPTETLMPLIFLVLL